MDSWQFDRPKRMQVMPLGSTRRQDNSSSSPSSLQGPSDRPLAEQMAKKRLRDVGGRAELPAKRIQLISKDSLQRGGDSNSQLLTLENQLFQYFQSADLPPGLLEYIIVEAMKVAVSPNDAFNRIKSEIEFRQEKEATIREFEVEIAQYQEDLKNQFRKHYINYPVEASVLEALIEDAAAYACEPGVTIEEAITRIDTSLRHDKAMFEPSKVQTQPNKRPFINISPDRSVSEFNSVVAKADVDEKKMLTDWSRMNTTKFYKKVRGLLKSARDSSDPNQTAAIAKLDSLINGYRNNNKVKERIDGYVRVESGPSEGAACGSGLDELFKTSETMKYIEFSYRPPINKSATALFMGKEFDWVDAQEQVRLSTNFIIWAGDLVETLSGHTGTFQNEYKGIWMVEKQDLMHCVRDEAISKRSNPANAIVEAITTHLRVTVNVGDFITSEIYKSAQALKALMTSGHSLAEEYDYVKVELAKHRNMLKSYLEFFTEHVEYTPYDTPPSPLIGRLGEDDYCPPSPKNEDYEFVVTGNPEEIEGNPLYNLAGMQPLKYNHLPREIPVRPDLEMPAVIGEIMDDFETLIDSEEVKKAVKTARQAGNRVIRKQGADKLTAINNAIIKPYINKVKKAINSEQDLNKKLRLKNILDKLEKALLK